MKARKKAEKCLKVAMEDREKAAEELKKAEQYKKKAEERMLGNIHSRIDIENGGGKTQRAELELNDSLAFPEGEGRRQDRSKYFDEVLRILDKQKRYIAEKNWASLVKEVMEASGDKEDEDEKEYELTESYYTDESYISSSEDENDSELDYSGSFYPAEWMEESDGNVSEYFEGEEEDCSWLIENEQKKERDELKRQYNLAY